jgi:hypothetical protein
MSIHFLNNFIWDSLQCYNSNSFVSKLPFSKHFPYQSIACKAFSLINISSLAYDIIINLGIPTTLQQLQRPNHKTPHYTLALIPHLINFSYNHYFPWHPLSSRILYSSFRVRRQASKPHKEIPTNVLFILIYHKPFHFYLKYFNSHE